MVLGHPEQHHGGIVLTNIRIPNGSITDEKVILITISEQEGSGKLVTYSKIKQR